MTKDELTSVRQSALEVTTSMGKWSAAERNTMFAFGVAITLWIVPGVMESFDPQDSDVLKWVKSRFPESVAALVGAGLLFMMPAKGSPSGMTFTWDEAKQIDWGTVLLFAGGIALGSAVFASGLAQMMGTSLAGLTGTGNVWLVTAVCMVAAVILSELASNTASATVIVPISIALAQGAGVNPAAPTIGAILACSLGFMFPVSTPPNALVFGTGYVSSRQMMRKGVWFDLVAVLATLLVLRLVLPLMGLV